MVGDDGRRTIFQFPPNAVKFDKLTNRRGEWGGGCVDRSNPNVSLYSLSWDSIQFCFLSKNDIFRWSHA